MNARIGQVLVETYRIERLIAEGGMGSVYEARHLRLPKAFAVKFLNLNLLGSAEALARFRREAEIVATLEHPSIVTLFDYNVTSDGVPYMVLEYLDGQHLGHRIERGRLTLAETMRILAPVVQALAAAHARGIIHRDLKPENIVLCEGGQVKVVDFGVSKIRGGAELTAMNTIVGTVPYMAPEQLSASAVDHRVDEFALGAIVYEMLSGTMAFGLPDSASISEVAARVAHHQPPPIIGVSEAVMGILLKALAKDATARFPTVHEFFHALVEAASRPETVNVPPLSTDELPPLAGEATTISRAPGPPPPALPASVPLSFPPSFIDDEDDPIAPPPEPSEVESAVGIAPLGRGTEAMSAVAMGPHVEAVAARSAPGLTEVMATVPAMSTAGLTEVMATVPAMSDMPSEATAVTQRPTEPMLEMVVAAPTKLAPEPAKSPTTPTLSRAAIRLWMVVAIVVLAAMGYAIRLLIKPG